LGVGHKLADRGSGATTGSVRYSANAVPMPAVVRVLPIPPVTETIPIW